VNTAIRGTRTLVLGLDCLVPDVLSPPHDELMPSVAAISAAGTGGLLESTLPPITVPAWTSMLTGRDPGELGVYGFRNRRTFQYGDLVMANSGAVRHPRVWDRVGAHGGRSIVVGVPQTSPPPGIRGVLVSGFEGPLSTDGAYTQPPELAAEVENIVGEYLFDVPQFRNADLDDVIAIVQRMTERRFTLMEHLLRTHPWDFAMLHEIGPDRMHHCFWHHHDPAHPGYLPDSPYADAIRDYYRFLDTRIARLLQAAGDDVAVLIASDHGAKAMHGGVCVNEILRREGLLTLRSEPSGPTPLSPDLVDWSRTLAWAEGGYYARIFLNVAGREPQGRIPRADCDEVKARIREILGRVELGDGRVLRNRVCEPAEVYRKVRGIPPDLLVFFDDERWRQHRQHRTGRYLGHGQRHRGG
jgi:predicted AlkP superfamily phosphohydrolase/phosphomutase